MFLGVSCDVANFSADGKSFSLYLYDDPLATFVELPEASSSDVERVRYSNVYCKFVLHFYFQPIGIYLDE